MKLKDKDIK